MVHSASTPSVAERARFAAACCALGCKLHVVRRDALDAQVHRSKSDTLQRDGKALHAVLLELAGGERRFFIESFDFLKRFRARTCKQICILVIVKYRRYL